MPSGLKLLFMTVELVEQRIIKVEMLFLEEINKAAKKGVIGVPSFNQWQKSFGNLDDLSEVKHKVAARKVKDASTI